MKRFFAVSLLALLVSLGPCRAEQAPASFSVCWWNIENWGETNRYLGGQRIEHAMKPPAEIGAVMAILKRLHPDILGVAEVIQAPDDRYLHLLRDLLAREGLDYRYMSTVRGEDRRIQVALFSRFPILDDAPFVRDRFPMTLQSASTGEVRKASWRVGRGFLNCRIEVAPGYSLQVMATHLKSKLPEKGIVPEEVGETGDEVVRRAEAGLLREHIDAFSRAHPGDDLLVIGDFNDVPESRAIRSIEGDASPVRDLPLADWAGETWTENDSYDKKRERIDYLFADGSLRGRFVPGESFLYRPRDGDGPQYGILAGSDHRALFARFLVPVKGR